MWCAMLSLSALSLISPRAWSSGPRSSPQQQCRLRAGYEYSFTSSTARLLQQYACRIFSYTSTHVLPTPGSVGYKLIPGTCSTTKYYIPWYLVVRNAGVLRYTYNVWAIKPPGVVIISRFAFLSPGMVSCGRVVSWYRTKFESR